jgi:hypothetical protein
MRRPLLTPSQRATFLSICTAVYGLAIGISTLPMWLKPAPPDQLPGFMKSQNLDAHASFRFFAAVIVATIATTYLFRPIVELLNRPDTRAWARNGAIAAMLAALWYVTVEREIIWTVVPAAIAIDVFAILRRLDVRFTRRDAILFAPFGATFMAICDVTEMFVHRALFVSAASVLLLRIALVFFRRRNGLDPALCFAIAPLALMLQSHFLARDQRHAGWPALLIIFVTPILMRLFVGNAPLTRRRVRKAIAYVIYPLAAYGYLSAAGLLSAEGKPRVSFFEDGQHLAAANAMLRGAKPYIDAIPPHGLIQDALIDYAILKTGTQTIGNVLRTRLTIGALMAMLCYALTAAATGSPDIGFLGYCAAALLGQSAGIIRFAPGVAALIVVVAALRRRKPGWLDAAGALAAIAVLTSIDFGVYAIAVVAFAALRFETRDLKRRAIRSALIGAGVTGAIAAIVMMFGGYFGAFIRVSLLEVATLGPVYTLTPWESTPALDHRFPEVLTALFDPQSFPRFVWIASLLFIALVLANGIQVRGRRRGRIDALLAMAFFILVVGVSYAERHHIYFHFAIAPMLVAAAFLLSKSRGTLTRLAAPAIVAVILIVANPTSHFAIVGWLRRLRGPVDPTWQESTIPRARGALFIKDDIVMMERVNRYITANLKPGETFVDFSNRGLLYFIFDREQPIRQIEAAYFEKEERQREVIERIARNPRVRAAIVQRPDNDSTAVDLVPNAVRAPLVWQYLQDHFEPAFEEGDVIIWRRK